MTLLEIETLLRANNVKTSGYLSVAELRALSAQASVQLANPKGAVTLLYSGTLTDKLGTAEVAESIGRDSGGRVRTIGQTDAGRILSGDPYLDAMAKAVGGDKALALQTAKDLIYGSRDAFGTRVSLGYFDDASARFIQESGGGRFQTLTPFAALDKVFGTTELSRVLADPKTLSINGISRQVLIDFQSELLTKGASQSAAFTEVFNLLNNVEKADAAQLEIGRNGLGSLVVGTDKYFSDIDGHRGFALLTTGSDYRVTDYRVRSQHCSLR